MAGTIFFFLRSEKTFFLKQNIFTVPAMQHGFHAKPLCTVPIRRNLTGMLDRTRSVSVPHAFPLLFRTRSIPVRYAFSIRSVYFK